MTAHESTNAHGDAHAAALLRSRQRAALAAWNTAVRAQRMTVDEDPACAAYIVANTWWHDAARAAFGSSVEITGPASVGGGY